MNNYFKINYGNDNFEIALDFTQLNETKVDAKNFKTFLKNNKVLHDAAVQIGLDSMAAYQQNKNITARFFAKTPYEKILYKDVSNTLVKSGNFKLVKIRYVNGGLLYELVKK